MLSLQSSGCAHHATETSARFPLRSIVHRSPPRRLQYLFTINHVTERLPQVRQGYYVWYEPYLWVSCYCTVYAKFNLEMVPALYFTPT
jgi:hypothetical protein